MKASDKRTFIRIGWLELVDLPDWGARKIEAKADTGARSSAIDVAEIEELPDDRVRFLMVLERDDDTHRGISIEAPILRRSRVRSSFGEDHDRLFVAARVRIGKRTVEAELGLVCRKRMRCRMLLGRRTLREGGFVVDPRRRFVKRRKKKAETTAKKTRKTKKNSTPQA